MPYIMLDLSYKRDLMGNKYITMCLFMNVYSLNVTFVGQVQRISRSQNCINIR